ncbi:MAG: hypothetical protein WEB06_02010 [Actinomycetota bacterium]
MSAAKRGARRSRSPFETVVLVVSLAAVSSIVLGLVVARVSGSKREADLRASIRATGQVASGGEVYELTIRNVGGETAENVVIEITLGEETREIELLSISKGDDESATVIFPSGSTGTPVVEVLSYHETTRG